MNLYHISIIGPDGLANDFGKIKSDWVDVISEGCYVFKKISVDSDGEEIVDVAYFPIKNTIIVKIEHDV